MYAISAVDIALWDVLGKAVGRPLWQLWGGVTDRVPVYGGGGFLSYTIDDLVKEAEATFAIGSKHYKMKVGLSPLPDLMTNVRRVAALRKAIGTFDITADYAKLRNTKVLYVQSPSDKLIDIAQSPGYVSDMRKAGIDITYVELPTNKGHMASHADAALWAPILAAFLKRLQ